MLNYYKSIKHPIPLREIDVYEFLEMVKKPEQDIFDSIIKARKYKANNQSLFYDNQKAKLPCFTLNFSFHDTKANRNIKAPSGFIYLDIDDDTDIDLKNPLVFASWLSLSSQGRGVLVKIDGLSIENFKVNYDKISKELNIKTDLNAAKPTQYTIHSYDKDLYINEDSETWIAINETENSPVSLVSKCEKRKGANELGERNKLHFDNIHFDGKDYIVFPDAKKMIAKAFIPKRISKGERNSKLLIISLQLRSLNPRLSEKRFSRLIKSINLNHCKPPMAEKEVNSIIYKALNYNELNPLFNTPRRVIFNPECTLNRKEKMKIVNTITGKKRSLDTLKSLEEIVINWDVNNLGKITQQKLANFSGRNIKTIEKHYKSFKDEVQLTNQSILLKPSKSLSPA